MSRRSIASTVVRDFPHNRPLHSSNFHKDNDESDSLQIFIYLVDIDDTRGPLVYVPGSNHYDVRSCRPRLSRDLGIAANDGRLSDEEVERSLSAQRVGDAAHRTRQHRRDSWQRHPQRPGVGAPRRSRITSRAPRSSSTCTATKSVSCATRKKIASARSDFERMTELQRLFAHATLVEEQTLRAAPAA